MHAKPRKVSFGASRPPGSVAFKENSNRQSKKYINNEFTYKKAVDLGK